MRQRSIRGWVAQAIMVTTLSVLPITVPAQDAPDDAQNGSRQGGVAFAGGQMVRGTVTAVAGDHLTLKTDAGEVYQVALSANTRLTKERQPVKVADIKVGDGVGAMGVLDAPTRTVHAVFVGVIDAEQVKKARENMGKTYITGKVTAIDMDALKLTVMRPDGVSQVIGVDEQTSFKRGGRGMAALASESGVVEIGGGDGRGTRRGIGSAGTSAANGGGGESITLADVKVGDDIAGRGALKNGTFVPTELGVIDPAAKGQRRRRAPEGGTVAPAAAPPAKGSTPVASPQ